MKVGDTCSVGKGKSILAKGITMVMRMYMKDRNIELPFVPHHSFKIVEHNGKMMVAESDKYGPVIIPLLKAYTEKEWKERIIVHTPIIPYTAKELQVINETAERFALEGIPYDHANILFSLFSAFSGIWLGPRDKAAEYRVYCSEYVATVDNMARPLTFRHQEATNPVDVATNTNYKIESIGVNINEYI